MPDRSNVTYFLHTGNYSEPHVRNDPPSNDLISYQSDFDHPCQLRDLVAESWNHTVLDSGASKTVCGRVWLQTYVDCLSVEDKSLITYCESSSVFRFGDGQHVQSTSVVHLPAYIRNKRILINTDAVD